MSRYVTSYAEAISDWEGWQREYRFGVLLLFPPEPLRGVVNRLRSEHDPRSQSYCDAHVSLTVPFPRPVSEPEWSTLEALASDLSPFTLHYGPLWQSPHPGVALDVAPFDELDGLRAVLESAPPFADAPPRRWPFRPHMTIAEFISAERTLALTTELADTVPTGSFLCDTVSYAVPDNARHFSERRRLELRGHNSARERAEGGITPRGSPPTRS